MSYLKRVALTALLLVIGTSTVLAKSTVLNLPVGTTLSVRISEHLNSEKVNLGDTFHGVLASAVVVNGKKLVPKGADAIGEVVQVERSGRLSNPGELHLALRSVHFAGRTYSLATKVVVIRGESHTKSNLEKIGGGTAAGALIGAFAGGGKGAAIGAGVGAAAGTGAAAATGKKSADVESEAVLTWTAAPAAENLVQANAGSSSGNYDSDDDHPRYENRSHSRDAEENYDGPGPTEFSPRERQIINDCFEENRSDLPPGLAKRERLPPGLERQLQRNGTLPPGLQKRVQPLPDFCTSRLPRLPQTWVRVSLGGRIILLDSRQRIVDMFWLE